jgi:hypothetical protein
MMGSMAKNDCLRQCIARVLEMPPSRVPHFVQRYKGRWQWHLVEWCNRRGIVFILAHHRARRRHTILGDLVRKWISVGTTKSGSAHAVVVENDRGVTYDGGNPLKRHDYFIVLVKTTRRRKRS